MRCSNHSPDWKIKYVQFCKKSISRISTPILPTMNRQLGLAVPATICITQRSSGQHQANRSSYLSPHYCDMMSHVTPTCALIVPYFQKKRANIVHCSYIIYFVSYIICYRRIEYLVTVKLRALSRPFLKKIEWGLGSCLLQRPFKAWILYTLIVIFYLQI